MMLRCCRDTATGMGLRWPKTEKYIKMYIFRYISICVMPVRLNLHPRGVQNQILGIMMPLKDVEVFRNTATGMGFMMAGK